MSELKKNSPPNIAFLAIGTPNENAITSTARPVYNLTATINALICNQETLSMIKKFLPRKKV